MILFLIGVWVSLANTHFQHSREYPCNLPAVYRQHGMMLGYSPETSMTEVPFSTQIYGYSRRMCLFFSTAAKPIGNSALL